MKVLIVIPALNEEASIQSIIEGSPPAIAMPLMMTVKTTRRRSVRLLGVPEGQATVCERIT
jgi:hypothetical protein